VVAYTREGRLTERVRQAEMMVTPRIRSTADESMLCNQGKPKDTFQTIPIEDNGRVSMYATGRRWQRVWVGWSMWCGALGSGETGLLNERWRRGRRSMDANVGSRTSAQLKEGWSVSSGGAVRVQTVPAMAEMGAVTSGEEMLTCLATALGLVRGGDVVAALEENGG
jgi:hypothetical protein